MDTGATTDEVSEEKPVQVYEVPLSDRKLARIRGRASPARGPHCLALRGCDLLLEGTAKWETRRAAYICRHRYRGRSDDSDDLSPSSSTDRRVPWFPGQHA